MARSDGLSVVDEDQARVASEIDERQLACFREYLGDDEWRRVKRRWREIAASDRFRTLFRRVLIPLYGGAGYLSSADLERIVEQYEREQDASSTKTASVDELLTEIRAMTAKVPDRPAYRIASFEC